MSSLKADEKYNALALLLSPGVGHANAKFILSHYPNLSEVFNAPKSRLMKIPGVGEKASSSIRKKTGLALADKIFREAEQKEIEIIPFHSESYPPKLRQIIDAPFILYYKGSASLAFEKSVGIVGTREASVYGKDMTQKIVSNLGDYSPAVISGLAYGIDIEAHRSALNEGLPTFAVMAGGLDRVYPSIHQKIADKMISQGGLLSEKPPGTKPDAHLFPARNRIIAGLSDALIVVEAKAKGGALITAALSDSYNRTVFAVPGNLNQQTSEGCNILIRNQKALIYTGHKDLQYHLGWSEAKDQSTNTDRVLPDLNEQETKVYELLIEKPTGLSIDDLSWQSDIQINLLSSVLLTLEFKGLVKSLPGKKYQGIN
jgi:DNA processing protein